MKRNFLRGSWRRDSENSIEQESIIAQWILEEDFLGITLCSTSLLQVTMGSYFISESQFPIYKMKIIVRTS